ncbi:MAG: acetoacetyl-CoA reductase [Alcaligenaceae bacterium]|nr:acetoacetyl-CoA reductase [Alcaligenaceae bacterium]
MTENQDRPKRIALVTGGIGGLGTAICRQLALDGMTVIAVDLQNDALFSEWLQEQSSQGFDFKVYGVDVRNFQACKELIETIQARIGPIDVLVNNAGITRDASLKKMSIDDWNDVLRTDLDSVFNMTRQVIEGMMSRGWGRVISISSVNGQKGSFGQTNYSAAKAGVHGFTKALALETARKGVTVNTISPGYIRTKMVEAVPEDIMKNHILPEIPVGRLGEPDEIAALVSFLASSKTGYITGSNISINGGQHMY